MARWEADARVRFVHAAVDLFAEQGYEATTVNEIAERAGLTKTTFFRHFSDKREVLFAGGDAHAQIIREAIASASATATPLQAVAIALDALTATFPQERRESSARLHPIIAGRSELLERAAFKRAGLAQATAEALVARGVAQQTAGLAAELGIRAYYQAYDLWTAATGPETFTDLARLEFGELQTAVALLNQG